jgi:hypothetical protein
MQTKSNQDYPLSILCPSVDVLMRIQIYDVIDIVVHVRVVLSTTGIELSTMILGQRMD